MEVFRSHTGSRRVALSSACPAWHSATAVACARRRATAGEWHRWAQRAPGNSPNAERVFLACLVVGALRLSFVRALPRFTVCAALRDGQFPYITHAVWQLRALSYPPPPSSAVARITSQFLPHAVCILTPVERTATRHSPQVPFPPRACPVQSDMMHSSRQCSDTKTR